MHWFTDVVKKYAVFEGRARRKEYWMFFLANLIISFLAGFVFGFLEAAVGLSKNVGDVFHVLYILVVLIPSIAVAVRRLHDTGKAGWWFLIWFVPVLGWITLIVFLCQDSEPGTNKYGPNPKGENATPATASFTSSPNASATAGPVTAPVVEPTPEAPLAQEEVVINDIPLQAETAADAPASPEEKA